MKKLLLILLCLPLLFTTCKKEDIEPTNYVATNNPVAGCTDAIATNYNAEATINDGSCEYPPNALELSSIRINAIPLTNNGSNWDVGAFGLEYPDVLYVLKQGGGDIVSSSSQDNISTFPILFTENLPYTINNLSLEYTIEVYDNDQIAGIGENEFIGSCSFIADSYISNLENEINITSNGIDMTLAVIWLP